MNITYYEFIAYGGSIFTDERGDEVLYSNIKDNFYKLNGRIGKIIDKGYTRVYEQGFSGGYHSYSFVFQDDLSNISLGGKIVFEAVTANTTNRVLVDAIEIMPDECLNEEKRVLTAEIEAAQDRLGGVETEMFYRKNPECRTKK